MEKHFTNIMIETIDNNFLYTDQTLRELMTMPQGPDINNYTEDQLKYIITLIILLVNNHSWQHKPSCFKKSKRTVRMNNKICRYLFPKERVNLTEFKNGKIIYKREIGK